MFGGFGNNGYAVTGGFSIQPELKNLINQAVSFCCEIPSQIGIGLLNEFIMGLKLASRTGNLSPFSDIVVYASTINYRDNIAPEIAFEDFKINNPLVRNTKNGVLFKHRTGYATDGITGWINSNYNPFFETVTTVNDIFFTNVFIDEVRGGRMGSQSSPDQMILFLDSQTRFRHATSDIDLSSSNVFTGRNIYTFRGTNPGFRLDVNGNQIAATSLTATGNKGINNANLAFTELGARLNSFSLNSILNPATKLAIRLCGRSSDIDFVAMNNAINKYLNEIIRST